MGFVKVSLLLYYRRIFISRPFIIFSKWPVYKQWNPEADYNVDVSAVLISFVVGNAIFDLFTLALPLATLRGLQMNSNRKLVLSIVFIFGSMCVAFAHLYFSM